MILARELENISVDLVKMDRAVGRYESHKSLDLIYKEGFEDAKRLATKAARNDRRREAV